MRTTIFFLLLFGLVGALGGCREKIDLALNEGENNRLVVEGSLTDQPGTHVVVLSRSVSYFHNEATPRETGAIVFLTTGNDTIFFSEAESGVYQSPPNTAGAPGQTYNLHIELADGETFTASETMPQAMPMDSVVAQPEYNPFDQKWGYTLMLYAQEPEGTGDYYIWDYYLNDKWQTDTLKNRQFADDQMVDGEYIYDFPLFWVEESELENDTTSLRLLMSAVTEKYFDYCIALQLETIWRGSPFDGPPANIPSNISNGGLGYFYVAGVSSVEGQIIKVPHID